jgi:hypothetical protein
VIRVAFAATHKTTIKDLTDFFTGSICNGHAHVCHAHDPAKGTLSYDVWIPGSTGLRDQWILMVHHIFINYPTYKE